MQVQEILHAEAVGLLLLNKEFKQYESVWGLSKFDLISVLTTCSYIFCIFAWYYFRVLKHASGAQWVCRLASISQSPCILPLEDERGRHRRTCRSAEEASRQRLNMLGLTYLQIWKTSHRPCCNHGALHQHCGHQGLLELGTSTQHGVSGVSGIGWGILHNVSGWASVWPAAPWQLSQHGYRSPKHFMWLPQGFALLVTVGFLGQQVFCRGMPIFKGGEVHGVVTVINKPSTWELMNLNILECMLSCSLAGFRSLRKGNDGTFTQKDEDVLSAICTRLDFFCIPFRPIQSSDVVRSLVQQGSHISVAVADDKQSFNEVPTTRD